MYYYYTCVCARDTNIVSVYLVVADGVVWASLRYVVCRDCDGDYHYGHHLHTSPRQYTYTHTQTHC